MPDWLSILGLVLLMMIHSSVISGVEQSAQAYPTRKAVGMVKALVLLVTATPYLLPLYLFYCFLQPSMVMHCPSQGRGGLGARVD